MKYTSSIEIKKPLNQVIPLFIDPENMKHWQPGFQRREHLEGSPGETGAVSRLYFQMGKRKIEMIETIVESNLPETYEVTYSTKGVFNRIVIVCDETENGHTRMYFHNEFKFSGFMKLMEWFMSGAFKKQTQQNLEQLKAFIEAS